MKLVTIAFILFSLIFALTYVTNPNISLDPRDWAAPNVCGSADSKQVCQKLSSCKWKSGKTVACSLSGNKCPAECKTNKVSCSQFANKNTCSSQAGCQWRLTDEPQCTTRKCSTSDCNAGKSGCKLTTNTYGQCSIARFNDGKELCEGGGGKWTTSKSTTCSGSYTLCDKNSNSNAGICAGSFTTCSGTYEKGGSCQTDTSKAKIPAKTPPKSTPKPSAVPITDLSFDSADLGLNSDQVNLYFSDCMDTVGKKRPPGLIIACGHEWQVTDPTSPYYDYDFHTTLVYYETEDDAPNTNPGFHCSGYDNQGNALPGVEATCKYEFVVQDPDTGNALLVSYKIKDVSTQAEAIKQLEAMVQDAQATYFP